VAQQIPKGNVLPTASSALIKTVAQFDFRTKLLKFDQGGISESWWPDKFGLRRDCSTRVGCSNPVQGLALWRTESDEAGCHKSRHRAGAPKQHQSDQPFGFALTLRRVAE
jgi:hypothetical protein